MPVNVLNPSALELYTLLPEIYDKPGSTKK